MKIAIKSGTNSTPVIAVLVAALAAAAGAGSAIAAQPDDALTKKVAYGDLDLESAQGAKALYARIRSAARGVCAPFESRELSRLPAWQACVDNAVESAVARINKPLVSALHSQSVSRSSGNKS